MSSPEQQLAAAREWMANPRFGGITRLYTARDIAEQQGTIVNDYTIARKAAEDFYARLRELFKQRRYGAWQHCAIAAGEGNQPGRQRDTNHSR